MENDWFLQQFDPAPTGAPFDYIRKDGQAVIEVKSRITGMRDIQASSLELAVWLTTAPQVQQAVVVILQPQVSRDRLHHEWEGIRNVVVSSVSRRLFLIALYADGTFVEPNDDFCNEVAAALSQTERTNDQVSVPAGALATDSFYDAFKVLLNRWLQRDQPISMRELMQQVGCSYPTAAKAVHRLQREQLIERRARRTIELSRFPRNIWAELLARSGTLRRTVYFHDTSDRSSVPDSLLRRIERAAPEGVAFGGVVAARHWYPEFNLNGIPQIDLIVHSPKRSADLRFLHRADPALFRHYKKTERTIVAVHFLQRAVPLFSTSSSYRIPIADPVETLLDLYDQHLEEQMDGLIRHLRPQSGSL